MIIHPQFCGTVLIFLFCYQISANHDADFSFTATSSCNTDSAGNFTAGDQYGENLNILISELSSQSSTVRFYNYTIAFASGPDYIDESNPDPDVVYGLFQCRRDVSLQVCSTCI